MRMTVRESRIVVVQERNSVLVREKHSGRVQETRIGQARERQTAVAGTAVADIVVVEGSDSGSSVTGMVGGGVLHDTLH